MTVLTTDLSKQCVAATCIVMAHIVMDYIVMVMDYVVMAFVEAVRRGNLPWVCVLTCVPTSWDVC